MSHLITRFYITVNMTLYFDFIVMWNNPSIQSLNGLRDVLPNFKNDTVHFQVYDNLASLI